MIIVLLFCCVLTVSKGQTQKNESIMEAKSRLLNDILEKYDKRIEPRSTSEPIEVKISLYLRDLIELNSKQEAMETSLFVMRQWNDPRLTWNATSYAGVKNTHMPCSQIWMPTIPVTNNVGIQRILERTPGEVAFSSDNGNVYWWTEMHTRTQCSMDMKHFPFDSHVCKLVMGAWTFSANELTISLLWNNSFTPTGNKEWEVVDSWSVVNNMIFTCCSEVYQDVVFALKLKRNPVYYSHLLTLPAVLLALLLPFQFLLPVQSKERITLGAILVLGIILLLIMLQDFLPQAHNSTPVIAIYYSMTLIWIALSMMASIIGISLETRGPRRSKIPSILRQIFLRGMKRFLCMGDDSYYALDEREIISMRGLNKSMFKFDEDPKTPGTSTSSKLERDVGEIGRMVHNLALRSTILESREEVTNEWKQLVIVIDRLLFCLFLFVFVMYTLIILS